MFYVDAPPDAERKIYLTALKAKSYSKIPGDARRTVRSGSPELFAETYLLL